MSTRVKLLLGPRQLDALWKLAIAGWGDVEGAEEGHYSQRERDVMGDVLDKLRDALAEMKRREQITR